MDNRALRASYRGLVLAFAVYMAGFLGFPALGIEADWSSKSDIVAIASSYTLLVLRFAVIYYGYATARASHARFPALWAVAMVIPAFGVLVLLALSYQTKRHCNAHGIDIGLFGPLPHKDDISPGTGGEPSRRANRRQP
jgi:hypothetical protein